MFIIQCRLDFQDELLRFREMAGACMSAKYNVFVIYVMLFVGSL